MTSGSKNLKNRLYVSCKGAPSTQIPTDCNQGKFPCVHIQRNPVNVFEKRTDASQGRKNTVPLKPETLQLLKYYGVYPYLLEKGLIFPAEGGSFNVRLKDLEDAMKVVIGELTQEGIINYESQLERIVSRPNAKVDLVIRSAGRQLQLNNVDVIVIAEGAHSPTNELLGNRRIAVLPSLPVIAAIFKDDRPSIRGVSTLFQYVGKTLAHTAVSVYYYAIFFFKCAFLRRAFFQSSTQDCRLSDPRDSTSELRGLWTFQERDRGDDADHAKTEKCKIPARRGKTAKFHRTAGLCGAIGPESASGTGRLFQVLDGDVFLFC
jgi:hypothetical protein